MRTAGGPVGKPGGNNKLFFFYSQEFAPRTSGNNVVRDRMPTELERRGDFSQTIDNNGNLYNLIRDAATGLPCTATDTRGCFQDGGVVGRIPQSRLYQTGLNILKSFPAPNLAPSAGAGAAAAYNYEITRPPEKLMAWQPTPRRGHDSSSISGERPGNKPHRYTKLRARGGNVRARRLSGPEDSRGCRRVSCRGPGNVVKIPEIRYIRRRWSSIGACPARRPAARRKHIGPS